MQDRKFNTLIGFAAVGAVLTGVGALLVALLAVSNAEFVAAGLCLTAAALAFGLLANAILRN
jgi:hypothetical protein